MVLSPTPSLAWCRRARKALGPRRLPPVTAPVLGVRRVVHLEPPSSALSAALMLGVSALAVAPWYRAPRNGQSPRRRNSEPPRPVSAEAGPPHASESHNTHRARCNNSEGSGSPPRPLAEPAQAFGASSAPPSRLSRHRETLGGQTRARQSARPHCLTEAQRYMRGTSRRTGSNRQPPRANLGTPWSSSTRSRHGSAAT